MSTRARYLELAVEDYFRLSDAAKLEVDRYLDAIGADSFSVRFFSLERQGDGTFFAEVHQLLKNEDGSFYLGNDGEDVAWEIARFMQMYPDGPWVRLTAERIN